MSVEDFIQEMENMIADFDAKLEEQIPVANLEYYSEDEDEDDGEEQEHDLNLREVYNKLIDEHLKLLEENENMKIEINKLQATKKISAKMPSLTLFNI